VAPHEPVPLARVEAHQGIAADLVEGERRPPIRPYRLQIAEELRHQSVSVLRAGEALRDVPEIELRHGSAPRGPKRTAGSTSIRQWPCRPPGRARHAFRRSPRLAAQDGI